MLSKQHMFTSEIEIKDRQGLLQLCDRNATGWSSMAPLGLIFAQSSVTSYTHIYKISIIERMLKC